MSLVDALKELQERYELQGQLTHDSLECLQLRAQINVVRDLHELLTAPLASNPTEGSSG